MNQQLTTFRLDHLGLVAEMAHEIGLVEIIDNLAGVDKNELVTTGQATLAMVINCLGFVSRPLYITPQFFKSRLVEFLIGKCKTGKRIELTPEHLNESKLGRTLDKIYEMGPDTLFQTVAFAAARKQKLKVKTLHCDTTSHSFYGEYESSESSGVTNAAGDDEPCCVEIVHGLSKDHRAECKQIVQELLVSSDGDVPLMQKVHSGNTNDATIFKERLAALKQQFVDAKDLMPEYIVFDCKGYSEENVRLCAKENQKWVTRIPDNVKIAKSCMQNAASELIWQCLGNDRKDADVEYTEFNVETHGVAQKLFVMRTKHGLERAKKSINKKIAKERQDIDNVLKKQRANPHCCEADARAVFSEFCKKLRFFRLDEERIIVIEKNASSGRPKNDQKKTQHFFVEAKVKEPNEMEVTNAINFEASFTLATNDIELCAQEASAIYRKEQQGVERAFRFLKNPMYFADAFFLKNRKRVVALVTIMTIALLIFSLLQRKLRLLLEAKSETVPNQKKRPTKKPTMNWVNLCFDGVDVIREQIGREYGYTFVRADEFVKKVLKILGPGYEHRYSEKFLDSPAC
jgi:transposase